MTALLLALDLGGTDLRATVLDERGRRVAHAVEAVEHTCDAPPAGRSYDPDALWSAVCAVIRAAVAQAGGSVDAVTATGQRIACAFLDGDGETLYIGPNFDARGIFGSWQPDADTMRSLHRLTGRAMPHLFAPARLMWFREHRPEVFERIRHVVGLGEWVAQRLCGETAIDICGAVELLGIDVVAGTRLDEVWSGFDLDPGWIPPVSDGGTRLGSVGAAAATATGLRAGTPVALSPPDSMAALLGAGAGAPGFTLVLAGSTMPVLASAAEPALDPEGRTWTGRHPVGGRGVNESNAGASGFAWAWAVQRLAPGADGAEDAFRQAEELAASAPPGSGGLVMLPGGCAVMDATRHSTLAGSSVALWPAAFFEPAVDRAEVARATLEAIAFIARGNLEQAEAARGGACGPVILAGGMARSYLFRQILADVIGRPVQVPLLVDATAVGAAACAAVALGVHRSVDDAVAAMTVVAVAAEPDPASSAAHLQGYGEWRRLYDKISSI